MALTDRQKEIKALLDKGQTPKQVGEALGISENAVYQQRRRIKAAGGTVKATATRRQPAKAAERPARRRQPRPAAEQSKGIGAVLAAPPTDPLDAVRERKGQITATLDDAKAAVVIASETLHQAQKAYDEAEAKVKPELERLEAAEALLTGKLKPPKPVQKAKPAPAPAPAPEPQPVAVATAQDQAAEAPDEPVEVPVQENGASEERPGVPTLPEFSQEDAFAS